jgi:microcystin-dependent protein
VQKKVIMICGIPYYEVNGEAFKEEVRKMPAIMGIDYKFDQTNTQAEVGGGSVPVGTILSISQGYFEDGLNNGFTPIGASGNTIADMNAWLGANHPSWSVCDGTAPADQDSPVWDDVSKHLPNLTNNRFICGSTSAGASGGTENISLSTNNLPQHKHNLASKSTGSGGSHIHNVLGYNGGHTHGYYYPGAAGAIYYINSWITANRSSYNATDLGSGISNSVSHRHNSVSTSEVHDHTLSGSLGSTGSGSPFSNIPQYLDAFYIVRIK